MALIESKVLTEITVFVDANIVGVKWENRILRDDQIIDAKPHRSTYSPGDYFRFIDEVDGAQKYIDILGWTEPVVEVTPAQ